MSSPNHLRCPSKYRYGTLESRVGLSRNADFKAILSWRMRNAKAVAMLRERMELPAQLALHDVILAAKGLPLEMAPEYLTPKNRLSADVAEFEWELNQARLRYPSGLEQILLYHGVIIEDLV